MEGDSSKDIVVPSLDTYIHMRLHQVVDLASASVEFLERCLAEVHIMPLDTFEHISCSVSRTTAFLRPSAPFCSILMSHSCLVEYPADI